MSFRTLGAILWSISVGALLWIATRAPLVVLGQASPGSLPLVGRFFSRAEPHLAEIVTPIAILALFAWVLIEIAVRARWVYGEYMAVRQFPKQVETGDLGLIRAQNRALRAPQRAYLIVKAKRADPVTLHDTLPSIAALDANALAASYGPLNVYAWILPVLGFIGTATGMASAIGGFNEALVRKVGQGEADFTIALGDKLSQVVIPGLSTAFETTILALTAALVAYLCTSALRNWDQKVCADLDKLCVETLDAIPKDAGGINVLGPISEPLQKFKDSVILFDEAVKGVDEVSKELRAASNKLYDSAMATYDITITRRTHRSAPDSDPREDNA